MAPGKGIKRGKGERDAGQAENAHVKYKLAGGVLLWESHPLPLSSEWGKFMGEDVREIGVHLESYLSQGRAKVEHCL